ncbi:MAG: tetratricopeptide repeat protein [Opitutaceae bacterium]|jgi:Tfp pilus assembly protein PilF
MEATSAHAFRRSPWWIGAALLCVTLAVYWPALAGGMVWDDDAHVTRPDLQSVAGMLRIWTDLHATQQYYPLLHSAFWLEHIFFGDSTLGYHLANVLLHAADAWLLVLLLEDLAVPGAALAGFLFAVHPVCVESVAWISEQKNTLSLLFYLLAARAYLRFDRDSLRPRTYVVGTAWFLCALLSKSVTATLPAALMVVSWWRKGRLSWSREGRYLGPWFALGIASGLFTSWVERTIGGAQGGDFDLAFGQRLLLAAHSLWFYVGTLLWPTNLILIYPRWNVPLEAGHWLGYFAAAAAITIALGVLARRRRGPLAVWLLFAGTLFPALGFVNVYPFIFSYVANHFLYHATLAPAAGAAAAIAVLARSRSANVRAAVWSVAGVLLCGLGLLSNSDAQTFESQRTLLEASLAQNPDAWMPHDSLGVWYANHGDNTRAAAEFRAALRLRPQYPQAHNNLGMTAEARGDLEQAAAEYREALALKPDFAEAHNNLGAVLIHMPGHESEAVAEFQAAVRLQPDFATAHSNLGRALLKIPGRQAECLAELRRAVQMRPDLPDLHSSLADALADQPGEGEEAVREYQAALQINPRSAEVRNNLGLALMAQGEFASAAEELTQAIALKPGLAEVRLNLAIAYLNQGRRAEAASQLDAYLQVRPANDLTRQILAQLQGK